MANSRQNNSGQSCNPCNPCKNLWDRMADMMEARLGSPSGWLNQHVATCPRCRKRLAGFGSVRLAMILLKSQPHSTDLLMRANRRAMAMLKCSTRQTTTAEALKFVLPRPSVWQRLGKYTQAVTSAAACLLILMLVRVDVLSTALRFRDRSQQFVQQHYEQYMDEDSPKNLL